jgi:phage repressor protein C with HTH and peptisase S24 domain
VAQAPAISGVGMVKRVRVESGGNIVLLSDNKNVPN